MWFQQNVATSHTTLANQALVHEKLRVEIEWCQLASAILRLRGYVKDRIYADSPEILNLLKTNIRDPISEILSEMYWKLTENYLKRIETC